MVYNAVVYSIVYQEIEDAILYYNAIYNELGIRFEAAVQQAFDYLETNPQTFFNLEDKKHRRIPIAGFPYSFIYSIADNEVVVKMLFPQLQDPSKLWGRIEK